MKKIKEYIDKELQLYKNKKDKNIYEPKIRKINYEKEELIIEYNKWIKNLYMSMHLSKFRQVLTEIESNKKKYIKIPELHWRFQIVQIRAIFRIIKKKLKKYKLVLSADNGYQNRSILFWFNQAILILEQLNLTFRFDINDDDPRNKNQDEEIIMGPIQGIYKGYIELLYLLIRYSYIRGEFYEIFAYLSMADSLANYALYIVNINSMPILQKIFLIRAKIYLANCDYLNATKYIRKTIDLCIEQLIYIVDHRLNLEIIDKSRRDILNYSLNMNKVKVKTLQNVLINIIVDFYLRGVLSELLGSTTGAIDSYKQSKFFATKFLKNKFYNFTMFFYHLQNNGFKYLAVMEEFQQFKEEGEIRNKMNNRIFLKKLQIKKLKYQRNYNKYYSKIRVNNNLYKGSLKKFLDEIGNKTLKEEENRQGILAKFRKAKFITSTMDLINIMLSNDFRSSLKKMKEIEISKYPKEVYEYLNSAFYKKNKLINDSPEMSKSTSNNRSKDLLLNESSQNTNNTGNFIKTKNLTNINSDNNLNKTYINYNLYNFKKNNLNNRYAAIFKYNKNINIINKSNKMVLNKKKLTNDSSYTTKLLIKKGNQSDLSILNSLDNDILINNFYKPNSTKSLFYKRNNNSSFILNHHNHKKKSFSFIDTKNISKNYSLFKNNFIAKRPLTVKKLFKIKINKSKEKEIKKDEYKINKDYFDKTLLKKKLFLDKCSIEELKFHRKLLKTKSCEIEPYKELLFEFDAKKTEEEAELAYDRMFELCKSSIGKKSFEHFFKNMKLFQTGANKEEEKKKFEQKNSQEYNSGKEFFDINNIYVNNNWNYTGNNYIFKNNEKNINLLDQEYGFLINRERELKIFKRKIKIK